MNEFTISSFVIQNGIFLITASLVPRLLQRNLGQVLSDCLPEALPPDIYSRVSKYATATLILITNFQHGTPRNHIGNAKESHIDIVYIEGFYCIIRRRRKVVDLLCLISNFASTARRDEVGSQDAIKLFYVLPQHRIRILPL